MSETKSRCTILGCRYPNKHSTAAHVEHDAYCSHPTDPRIAAADAMAKALQYVLDVRGIVCQKLGHADYHCARCIADAALAAYNALQPKAEA